MDTFLDEWNELGKSELAKYIVHRRATLDLLKSRLRIGSNDRYPLEEAVHRVVFPLRSTSEDLPFDKQNLWILDERLAYHYYLASDRMLNTASPVSDVGSKDRPDLLIFDNPIAMADEDAPFSAIVIFEFKRPMRNDYDDRDKNPITQVLGYVEDLRGGSARDRHGRPLVIGGHTPCFCYIVCDITPTLRRQAGFANLDSTADREGYFGYNKAAGAYIEIMSFDKVIRDAEKRNRILFEKLNLHLSLATPQDRKVGEDHAAPGSGGGGPTVSPATP